MVCTALLKTTTEEAVRPIAKTIPSKDINPSNFRLRKELNVNAFEIRVQPLRTIVPQPQASVSPHVRAVSLDSHKWSRPCEPLRPAMVQKPFWFCSNPSGQIDLRRWLVFGLAEIYFVSSYEIGWVTEYLLWGLTPPKIRG
jgi:hypothetical protein